MNDFDVNVVLKVKYTSFDDKSEKTTKKKKQCMKRFRLMSERHKLKAVNNFLPKNLSNTLGYVLNMSLGTFLYTAFRKSFIEIS